MHRFSPSTGSLRLGYPLSSRSQHVLVLEYDDSIQDDSLFVKKKFEKKGILYDFVVSHLTPKAYCKVMILLISSAKHVPLSHATRL